jgi:hypothetical protein
LGLCAIPAFADDPAPVGDGPLVLHIGDSFVQAGLMQALKPMFNEAGARYMVRARQSMYTPTAIHAFHLPDLVRSVHPALVIVTLGANEMRMPRPDDHSPAIKEISRIASSTSCIWITPPPPASGQTGIVEVIKRDSVPCRVFDSTQLADSIPRGPDKIHPTPRGGALWAKAFWDWLQTERDTSKGDWALKPRPDTASQ